MRRLHCILSRLLVFLVANVSLVVHSFTPPTLLGLVSCSGRTATARTPKIRVENSLLSPNPLSIASTPARALRSDTRTKLNLQGEMFNFETTYEFPKTPKETLWRWIYDDDKRFQYAKDSFKCANIYSDENGDRAYELEARSSELPITLKFTQTILQSKVVPYERIEYTAKGHLDGGGGWEFADRPGGGTTAKYTWNVRFNYPILKLLTYIPFCRKAAEKNHNALMALGRKELGVLLDDPPTK